MQANWPAVLLAIDGHGNFGVRRRVIDRMFQDEEIRAELGNRQDPTVEAQFHADIG